MNRPLLTTLGLAAAALLATDARAQLPAAATPRPLVPTPRPLTPPAASLPPLSTATTTSSLPPLSTATTASSFSGFGSTSAQPAGGPPMRDVPLVEKKFEALSNQHLSEDGKKALAINPDKWKHAETDNFILHYRRVTEAQKVAREVEYNLWYVANALGAKPERYKKKSHVYIFEDGDEWKDFLNVSSEKMKWAVSYAWGDELYLNVRGGGNSGPGTSFDSHTLAHETTHAVVARLYPGDRWPLWLNEGFAEYMGGASVAARKMQYAKRYERSLNMATMPLETLATLKEYPDDPLQVPILYETSEKFVRFLLTEHPKEKFLKYVDAVVGGKTLQEGVLLVYGDKYKDWDSFEKRYEKFSK